MGANQTNNPNGPAVLGFLPVQPFPAFNALNWGALTPARAALAGIEAFRLNLSAWRSACDAWRAMAREQQDLYIRTLERQLAGPHRSKDEKAADDEAIQEAVAASPLSLFETYSALSRDFLAGQHAALDALTARR